MQVKKQQLELDVEEMTGSNFQEIEKGVHQGYKLLPCLFNIYAEYIMRNAGLEPKHKLESRLPEKYQSAQICR